MRSLAAVIGLLTGLGVLSAQVTVFYQQDFNSGVPTDWSLNTGDLGSATSDFYNRWVVDGHYPAGSIETDPFCANGTLLCWPVTIPAVPNQPAGIVGGPQSNFLYVSYVHNPNYSGCTPPTVNYLGFLAASGSCTPAQHYFAKMNTPATIPPGSNPVKLSFIWICEGGPQSYGEVYYSTNGTTWNILTSSRVSSTQLRGRNTWQLDTITLPITRPANIYIAFRFNNDVTLTANEPSFGVDAIRIFEEVPVTGPTIDITSITPAQVCAGSSVSVAFSTSGTFNAGNQFTAQLSDAAGSFAAPIATATGAGSPITLTVPAGTATGTYKVRVVSTSPAVISDTVDLQVVNLSNLTCTATPNPGSPGTPVTLTISGSGLPAGPFNVSLNPGDGSPSQPQNGVAGLPVSFNHTYASAGSYTATFTVTHPASGCSQTCQVTVQVSAPGSPTITLQPPVPWVCSGDGFTVSFSTTGTFGANNTFSVQLSDATGSFANPTVIGSGSGSPIACVMPATTPSGNYKIRVVASDPAGTVSNEQPISVANLSGLSCSVSPVPVPAGQTATFTVGGNGLPAGSYNITFTPGNGDPNQNLTNQTLPATLTHTYNADGQYTAQIQVVHTPSGCVQTCNVTVFVGQQALTLTALQPTAVCAGETFTATYQATNITFGTGNLFILEITDGGGNVVSRCTTTSTAAQGTMSCAVPASLAGGSYTVRLVSTNPSFQSGTQPLTVLSKPVADFTPSDTILNLPAENVVIFTNNSTGAVSYTWDFGNGQTSTQATPDPVFYTTPGTYRVMLIATSAGGCRDTAMAVITVRAAEELTIPNAFTPNGDGVNDRFVIRYSGAERIEVSLYDRWGNPVWSQAQTALSGTLEWDGTIKGSPAPESVYTGAVRLKTITGKEVVKGFTVTLLR
jgi:gliding motility-associated-like protein